MLTGGAIGQGPSAATGAAIACPNRKVINFQSDGCGAYSVQAFWTQARENLDVVTIIGSNRIYQILELEFTAGGRGPNGPDGPLHAALG
jgi:acetolactate synthase-1/2/3 large subunit